MSAERGECSLHQTVQQGVLHRNVWISFQKTSSERDINTVQNRQPILGI